MEHKIDSIVKLNPDIFKENFKPDGQYGSLGYIGFMKDWKFKIIGTEYNEFHNTEIICCEVIDTTGVEGNIKLLPKDVIIY